MENYADSIDYVSTSEDRGVSGCAAYVDGFYDGYKVAEAEIQKQKNIQECGKVIEKCRESGCCELEVSTMTRNKKAREFYRKCGFEEK